MNKIAYVGLCGTAMMAIGTPAAARPAPVDLLDGGAYDRTPSLRDSATRGQSGLPYLECVPYARQVTGIDIHGDALTWWDQAAGRYARGFRPAVGAVMSFRPYGPMQLGHVAAVSRVIDSRTLLLRHANWSPIDGRRGQIEDDVRAVDVSPDNDWSAVRVWYAPLGDLGTTHWPVNGFIYNRPPVRNERLAAISHQPQPSPRADRVYLAASTEPSPASSRIGADFLKGIVPESQASAPKPVRVTIPGKPNAGTNSPAKGIVSKPAQLPGKTQGSGWRMMVPVDGGPIALPGSGSTTASLSNDPIGRIIAARVPTASR